MSNSTENAPPGLPPAQVTSGHLKLWRLIVVIGTLCLGVFLYGLDANIIGTAIPRITTEFGSLSNVAWYGSAYLLTVTAFQPLFGNLYKFYSAKFVYLASLLVFESNIPLPFSPPFPLAYGLSRLGSFPPTAPK